MHISPDKGLSSSSPVLLLQLFLSAAPKQTVLNLHVGACQNESLNSQHRWRIASNTNIYLKIASFSFLILGTEGLKSAKTLWDPFMEECISQ